MLLLSLGDAELVRDRSSVTVAVGLSDHDELGVEDNVGSKVRVGVAVSVGSSDGVPV